MARVVVLDSEQDSYRVIKHLLGADHRVELYEHPTLACEHVRDVSPDVVFLNIDQPDWDALELLDRITSSAFGAPVVAIVDDVNPGLIVEAVHRGACDVVARPIGLRELQLAVTRALARRQLHIRPGTADPADEMIGTSAPMIELRALIARIARSSAPVVIRGESGVGKELVARAIHRGSSVSLGPFEARNCGAIPDTLFESEIFGTEKGAYTDAVRRPGAFELADRGTLFLDEIGDLSATGQVKFLRAIESGSFYRVGGTELRRVNSRLIVATNRDLRSLVASGRFRLDLFYRIDIARISVPPLRERREDVPLLVRHFLGVVSAMSGRTTVPAFAPDALERLSEYEWPGNVRELRNVVWRAVLSTDDDVIRAGHVSFD